VAAGFQAATAVREGPLVDEAKPLFSHWTIAVPCLPRGEDIRRSPDANETWEFADLCQERRLLHENESLSVLNGKWLGALTGNRSLIITVCLSV